MKLLRGPSVRAGDIVGVVAPASGFDEANFAKGIAALESRDFRVKLGSHTSARNGQYFAGTTQQRADDLHAMFAEKDVRAIFCARGGFGSQGVLPLLDLDLVRANPKPLVGCSDLSALQLWLLDRCGLASLHGPMVAGDFAKKNGVDFASLDKCFSGATEWSMGPADGLSVLRKGTASGKIWGGCLSILVSSLATPYELMKSIEQDVLLFVEDIAEKPYKIERMIWQWRQAGKLARVRGIVFGEMLDCVQPGGSYKLTDVLARVFEDFDGPIAYGLRSGHVSRGNVTLPLGVKATLTCGDSAVLTLHEAATISA